eukprot:676488-Amphidinium_carterae.1
MLELASVSHSSASHCALMSLWLKVPTSQCCELAVISAVSATSHSRSDSTQCSNQSKGDVRDQSDYQECDHVCDQSHNYEESEKGQYEPQEKGINAQI